MNEPRRLRQEDGLGADLLSAARAYRPPSGVRRHVRRMLGLPLALSLGATLSGALASASAKVLLVVTAVTAASGGGVVAYRVAVRHRATRPQPSPVAQVLRATPAPAEPIRALPSPAPAPVVPAPASRAAIAPVPARRLAALAPRERPVPAAPLAPAPPPVLPIANEPRAALTPPALPSPPAPASAPNVVQPPLSAEIALLEAADRALRRQDFPEALARLQEHRQGFSRGVLGEEAALLRIAALFGGNQRAAARAEAQRFLTHSSSSLLADRVRSMLAADANQIRPQHKGERP